MYFVTFSNLFCIVKYYINYVNYQCIRHYTVLNHNLLYIIKIKHLKVNMWSMFNESYGDKYFNNDKYLFINCNK